MEYHAWIENLEIQVVFLRLIHDSLSQNDVHPVFENSPFKTVSHEHVYAIHELMLISSPTPSRRIRASVE